MSNNSFSEIGSQISYAKTMLLYPHVNMDGDTLGSSVALCKAVRSMGKECYVLIEDNIPNNLAFLDNNYCTFNQDVIEKPDISMCIDCGDIERFAMRKEKFLEGKITICIDHHETTKPFCDFNYIDEKSAATGELIFKLLLEMKVKPDSEIGEAIFAAITTDTGDYQYSNTTKESHLITASLYDWGIDGNKVSRQIYENIRLEKMMIKNTALGTLSMVANGKGAIAFVTQDMLRATGATSDETEGIVDDMRNIRGVEIAAFLKEEDDKRIKISFRAKSNGDVSEIAAKHGGGGHKKAAGCTINESLLKALELIKEEVIKNLEEL